MMWTREHDALIARIAEGVEILTCEQMCDRLEVWSAASRKWYHDQYGDAWVKDDKEVWIPLYAYSTDLVAAVRAAEAWCGRHLEDDWYWSLCSPKYEGWKHEASLIKTSRPKKEFEGLGDTPAAALALAVWDACGGPD